MNGTAMLGIEEIGLIILILSSVAFLSIWYSERQNHAAGYWGLAHILYALAMFTGLRYQEQPRPIMGLISLLAVCSFLVMFYAGNRAMSEKHTRPINIFVGVVTLSLIIGFVGFGINQLAGRIFVQIFITFLFLWSGWHFWSRFNMPLLALAFIFRALTNALRMTQGVNTSTAFEESWIVGLNWFSAVLLAFALIIIVVRQTGKRMHQIMFHLPDALVARRLDGTVLFCNQHFATLAGKSSPSMLIGKRIPQFIAGVDQQNIIAEVNEKAISGQLQTPLMLERPVHDAAGKVLDAEIIYSSYQEFGFTAVVIQIRDISERKRAESERIRLLTSDPLTGLLNRQGLELEFQSLQSIRFSEDAIFALLMIDIHRFKKFNSIMGPQRSDTLLCSVSQVLLNTKRSNDIVSRTASDEFVIVCAISSSIDVRLALSEQAEHILRNIRREERAGDVVIPVHACIGIAVMDSKNCSLQTLFQRAQLALQAAKSDGPDKLRFFDPHMDIELHKSIRIESALRDALTKNELSLHYQPIVFGVSGDLVKVEALVRWNSPLLGPVSPAVFIPIAEQSHLIIELGRWILDAACKQASEWAKTTDRPPIVGVNISVLQFSHHDFESELNSLISNYGLNPHALDLEVTETLFADHNDENIQNRLKRLVRSGFGLSLDDFGTGYSSLSYLANFPLTAVKIDRSFVRYLERDERQRSIVRAIISMGHSLGLKVVAEGVETEAERCCLVEDKCDYLQGYLLGRPVPPGEISFDTKNAKYNRKFE